MADGESTETELSDSLTRLDSISDQFQGILMDIHSSMMGDTEETVPPEVKDGSDDVSIPILPGADVKQEGNPLLDSLEDIDMIIGDAGDGDTPNIMTGGAEFREGNADILQPTSSGEVTKPVSSKNDSDIFASDDWIGFESTQQIQPVDGAQNGFLLGESSQQEVKNEGLETDTVVTNSTGGDGIVRKKERKPTWTFKIFVKNFPPSMLNEELEKLFAVFGTVYECEIFPFKNFAFVHMGTESEGLKAIEALSGKVIDSYTLSVSKSKVKVPEPETVQVGTFKLFLNNLHDTVTKDYVMKLLEPFGRVVEAEILRRRNNNGTSAAFVHMEEESAAREAVKGLNGKILPEAVSELPLSISESNNPEGPKTPTIKLQVTNIPSDVTPEIIRSLFQPFGLIIKCTLAMTTLDPLRKSIVYIEQLGDIRTAIKELNGFEFKGCKLVVEPLLDTQPSPVKKERVVKPGFNSQSKPLAPVYNYKPTPMTPSPNPYGYGNRPYNNHAYEPPVLREPLRGIGRGGRGGRIKPTYQLVPMPSVSDMAPMPPTRGMRGRVSLLRGRGGFGVRGGHHQQPLLPRPYGGGPKRSLGYDSGFEDPYSFDEYYEDPAAVNSRSHYAAMEEEYEQYDAPVEYVSRNPLTGYGPPVKRGRGGGMFFPGRGRGGGMPSFPAPGRGGGMPSFSGRGQFTPLMNVEFEEEEEEPINIPYQPHAYPSLNYPLGEREYFKNVKKGPQIQDTLLKMATTSTAGAAQTSQRNLAMNQQKEHIQQLMSQYQTPAKPQQWGQQASKPQVQQQQWGQQTTPGQAQQQWNQQSQNYTAPNYLVPQQIPSSASTHSSFGQTTAYPSNYYADTDTFNAVPFDYKPGNKKNNQKTPQQNQSNPVKAKPLFPPGVNPADYADLKPGSKVYINGTGKVMVRGSRGGAGNKRKRPGLGSKKGGTTGGVGQGLSGANQVQIGTAGTAGPSYFNKSQAQGYGKFKTKQQVKDDNQDYTQWLQQKSWLYQAIPGTVRPSNQ